MTRRKIIALIVGAAVVLTAFLVVVSGILPYRVFIVHTGSMEPTISSRSAVIVQRHVYRVGQPISFYEQGGVVTHRLARVNSDGTAVTKGDANTTADPWTIKTSSIIGGVVAAPPELGYWLVYLKNPFGLMSILLCVVVCWQLLSLGEHEYAPDDTPAKRRFWRRSSVSEHAAADSTETEAWRTSRRVREAPGLHRLVSSHGQCCKLRLTDRFLGE
ncbi:signal peptidase I [Lacisediminihabitans profunda]|uniref:Signal peptidase I n=1 Tax=Lacisediminihabitans profunda TaxID=2594790 RepID=A0A5C8UNI6_9MICO|nr:signal peptidase I [Lacisediminihabitans profunda]TXN28989.1 signal peptidase I [Lacisediminihabitans profunda]